MNAVALMLPVCCRWVLTQPTSSPEAIGTQIHGAHVTYDMLAAPMNQGVIRGVFLQLRKED